MAINEVTPFERDAALVAEFQRGDKEAFNQLMRIHLPWIYGLCRRITGAEAEDLCQDIFLEVYRNLPGLKHPQTFIAWLRKLAWHWCQKAASKARHPEVIEESIVSSNPWNAFIDGIELGWAFDQLPAVQRNVVVLSLIYGYREKEISQVLGIPHGTVKSRLHKARRTLQNLLTQTEGDIDVDIRERIVKEVEDRIQGFNDKIIRPSVEDPEHMRNLDENARWWHQTRQADAENNAKLYGIELADSGPRMTREKIMSETLSRVGITLQVMGVPESANLIDIRDVSRRLLVSPFTLLKWERQGMPVIRYFPWKRFDLDLVKKWLADNGINLPKEVTIQDLDNHVRYVLIEVQAGRANVDDAMEILESL